MDEMVYQDVDEESISPSQLCEDNKGEVAGMGSNSGTTSEVDGNPEETG